MRRLHRSPARVGAVLAASSMALVATACGNAKSTVSTSGNADGVTAHEIVVGGIASLTGPIPADFAPIFDGVKAYLQMVNAEGGVNGRTIDFAYPTDDGSNASQDTAQAHNLVDQDHVFAVVGVGTPTFSGATFLVQNDVPTFGYDVSTDWSKGDNLFGSQGSFISFTRPGPEPAFLAEHLHAKRVGILAYNVTASSQGCQGVAYELQKFHIPVVYEDLSIQPPPVDLTADVNRMKADGVDLVASCMDLSGNRLLSQTMHQDGMGAVDQYWLNGYDEAAIQKYASLMDGVYFLIGHAPFESARLTPGKYPGLDSYLTQLAKYFPGEQPSEASLAGWVNADLFVTGLKMLGHDVTRTAAHRRAQLAAELHRERDRGADRLALRAPRGRPDRLQRARPGGERQVRAGLQLDGDRLRVLQGPPAHGCPAGGGGPAAPRGARHVTSSCGSWTDQ